MVKKVLGRQKYCVSLRSEEKKHACSFWLMDSNSSLSFHYAIFQCCLVFLVKGICQLFFFFLRLTSLIHPSYSSFPSTSPPPNTLIPPYLWIYIFFSVSREARFFFFFFLVPCAIVNCYFSYWQCRGDMSSS